MVLAVTDNKLEGYGKASVVGIGGEIEHAQALTHTVWFGNQYRDAVDAKTYLAFANLRGTAGCPLVIPLMDKHDAGRRSHYQTIHLNIPDAPADDEIVIALGASVGGHPHHRIGDRYGRFKGDGARCRQSSRGYEIAPDGTAYDVLHKADAPVVVLIHGWVYVGICGVTILPILPAIIRW